MYGTSLAKTVRAAESLIERHQRARTVPKVIWAGIEEAAEAFALRCARLQLNGADRILAAVPHGFGVPDSVQAVPFPPKLFKLLHPSTPSRYRVASGGRGSAKSHSFATALVLRALTERSRILCGREFMKSIKESVHHLIEAKIDKLGLRAFFDITDRSIECVTSGSEFIFHGLFANADALKSLEEIKIAWIEQAEKVTHDSFEVLEPTVRDEGSEILFSMNPDDPEAPIQEFADGKRPDTLRTHVIFSDNPWFPSAMEPGRLYLQSVDPDAYAHIYLGLCRFASDAQVFAGKWSIEAFTPDLSLKDPGDRRKDIYANLGRDEAVDRLERQERESTWDGPYYGADWGFSVDPTTLVKCWIYQRNLYIEFEAYEVGRDIHRTPELFDQVPDARKHVIRGDNARPETISYLKQHGYPKIEGVAKWKGSVEDGVAFMRSFEKIIIHPRCTNAAAEFRLYSYKKATLTGDVLPDLEDKNNHLIDAIRYALTPAIKRRRRARFTPLRI